MRLPRRLDKSHRRSYTSPGIKADTTSHEKCLAQSRASAESASGRARQRSRLRLTLCAKHTDDLASPKTAGPGKECQQRQSQDKPGNILCFHSNTGTAAIKEPERHPAPSLRSFHLRVHLLSAHRDPTRVVQHEATEVPERKCDAWK